MNKEIYNFLLWDQKLVKGERSGLSLFTLKDFLYKYGGDLQKYYSEDFYVQGDEEVWPPEYTEGCESDSMILCMVDTCDDKKVITKKSVRKSLRKAGSERRRRIKHRYSYENPMNRIHGFAVLKREYSPTYPEKKLMSISTIATTIFSENRGVGSDMMDIIIHLGNVCKYDDIILEAANEHAYYAFGYESEEEEEEWDTEEEEEGEEEEQDNIWYPTEEVLEIITHELWRKTMRKPEGDNPYYNLGKDYIWENVESYLLNEIAEEGEEEEGDKEDVDVEEDVERVSLPEEPEDYEYGGFWYKKGKESQSRLMEFYGKFGFVEDPDIYLNWACYDENPYPTMRYSVVS